MPDPQTHQRDQFTLRLCRVALIEEDRDYCVSAIQTRSGKENMWRFEDTLARRFEQFHDRKDGLPISIKPRAQSGCFDCRNCNPILTRELDGILLRGRNDDFEVDRHETGPEWIVYATAGLLFLKSLAELLVTILKSRSEGQAKGDKNDCDVEVIVRGFSKDGKLFDEIVLRIRSDDPISTEALEKAVSTAIRSRLPHNKSLQKPISKPRSSKRKEPPSKQNRKRSGGTVAQ
jgi:hypothetical protein